MNRLGFVDLDEGKTHSLVWYLNAAGLYAFCALQGLLGVALAQLPCVMAAFHPILVVGAQISLGLLFNLVFVLLLYVVPFEFGEGGAAAPRQPDPVRNQEADYYHFAGPPGNPPAFQFQPGFPGHPPAFHYQQGHGFQGPRYQHYYNHAGAY